MEIKVWDAQLYKTFVMNWGQWKERCLSGIDLHFVTEEANGCVFNVLFGGCDCISMVMPPSTLDHLSMYLWFAFPKFCPRCEHIIIYLIVPTAIHSEDDDDDDYGTHRLEKTQHLFCYVTRFGGDFPWNHIHTFIVKTLAIWRFYLKACN